MLTEQSTDVGFVELLDALPDSVVWMRALRNEANEVVNFQIDYANQKAQDLTQSMYQVCVGTLVLGDNDHIKAFTEKSFQVMCRVLETGQPHEFDFFNPQLNGWFLMSRSKLGDGVLCVTREISSLKIAEQAHRRQTNLLNSVLDSSLNGIMSFASVRDDAEEIIDFTFLSANKAACRMVAKPVDEIIGQRLLLIFPGNIESGLFAKYIETAETGEPTRTETYYSHDGLDFWLDISAEKLGDGFVVTFTDITVQKLAAKVVERAATELQTIIDTSQTGIFLFSPVYNDDGELIDFRFRVANRQLAAYVGQQPKAVIGALGSTWFPEFKTNGLFDRYRQTYETGEQVRFDFHYNGDGIDVWLDIMATKMGNDVLVTFADYTPLKRLQQQLENTVTDLQRSNKNLEQFAYVASHDLQEPLRKIQAFGDIIQSQYASVIDDSGADMIRRMQSAAARMQVLIKDVLAYSRVATIQETLSSVNLGQIVNDVLTDLETPIFDKQALITVDKLPIVQGDAAQLRQLFQNLLSNALKFSKISTTSSVPTITITNRRVHGRIMSKMAIPAIDADRLFHLITVTDNGIGFDPNQAERIFQVFQRLHTRSEYQGTGIGLAIVQKVVENHQGYVHAEGRPGQGATFSILLPVSSQA
ncbi:hypothetical protein GCM10028808_42620 [Spirosoma migulaei]